MTESTLINFSAQALAIGLRLALLAGLGAIGYIVIRLVARRGWRRSRASGATSPQRYG